MTVLFPWLGLLRLDQSRSIVLRRAWFVISLAVCRSRGHRPSADAGRAAGGTI